MIPRTGQSEKEVSLRKYFMSNPRKPTHAGPLTLMAAGALPLFLGLSIIDNFHANGCANLFLFPGIGAIIMALMLISKQTAEYLAEVKAGKPKPADSQVQQWLDDGFKRLIDHSRVFLSLNEEEEAFFEPIVIKAPILWRTAGISDDDLAWKRGTDGTLRFGIYRITMIRLTDRHLASYACDYNFIRDVPLNEGTDEYHYQDIVSVSTREQASTYMLPTGDKLTTTQDFTLSVTSGESIKVTIDSAQIRSMTKVEKLPETGAERAVTTIRAMLRDKKG